MVQEEKKGFMSKLGTTLKRFAVATLFMVTPITMTGCAFDFAKDLGNDISTIMQPLSDEVEKVTNLTQDAVEGIKDASEKIDMADLKDGKDVESLMGDVLDAGNKIADENGIEFIKATLIRVVDGDTIVVEIENEQKKVRLIGIDTPESVASQEYLDRTGKENTEAGKTASEYTKSLLKDIKEVYLQKDTSDTDRYGRLLRYVWIEKPDNAKDVTEIATKMLNGILIKDGYAELATYPPDTSYKADFEYVYKMSHYDGYEDGEYDEEYDR